MQDFLRDFFLMTSLGKSLSEKKNMEINTNETGQRVPNSTFFPLLMLFICTMLIFMNYFFMEKELNGDQIPKIPHIWKINTIYIVHLILT